MDAILSGNLAMSLLAHVLSLLFLAVGGLYLLRDSRHARGQLRVHFEQAQTVAAENESLRRDLRIAASQLDKVDPTLFRDRLARLERDQRLSEADQLVEAFFGEQADAIADAARVMAEREVFLSHDRGASGLPDAIRFAELGLAARPADPHLGPLLEELQSRAAQIGDRTDTPNTDEAGPPELDDIDLLDIARRFLMRDQFGLAGITARRAAAIAHEVAGARSSRLAAALSFQAEALQALDRLDEAAPLMQQAVEIAAETLGSAHPNYLTGLRNLADLLRRTGRFDEAETCLRQVLTLMERSVGTHHPDYAEDFRSLTSVQKQRAHTARSTPLGRATTQKATQANAANMPSMPPEQMFRSRRAAD